MGSVSAALQPRSQPDRDGLLKTQGSSARQSCPNNRRTLQSHRTNLRPVPTRRVQKLFQRRRIRIQLNVRRSNIHLSYPISICAVAQSASVRLDRIVHGESVASSKVEGVCAAVVAKDSG